MSTSEKTSRPFVARLLRASTLDAATFGEIAAQPGTLAQAALIVAVGGAARGLAAFRVEGWLGLAGSVVAGLVFWAVVTIVVRGASGAVLGSRPASSGLASALGFAAAPLWALFVIPLLPSAIGGAVFSLAHLAASAAAVVAVREACDTTLGRALLICATALLVGIAVLFVIGLLLVRGESYAAG